MFIQLIRSATIKLDYAGKTFLIDPNFADKHTMPSYMGKSLNPLTELPLSPKEIMWGVDFVIISHLHSDHFDQTAQNYLPTSLPIICQNEDACKIREMGFANIIPLKNALALEQIKIVRTPCKHGSGQVLHEMGIASGFLFKSRSEAVLYWAGDTIWCDAVQKVIAQNNPEVIVTHSCGAIWGEEKVKIVMDAAQTIKVCQAAAYSKVIATHMEAYDHATQSRSTLRAYACANNISSERLLIPYDGEIIRI